MMENTSKRKISIITEIIIFCIILVAIVFLFYYFYKPQTIINNDNNIVQNSLLDESKSKETIEAENKMYIKNIKDEYGIKVRYGEDIELFATKVGASAQYDANILNNNLKIIYKALEKYPDSVFEMSRSKKYPITIFVLDKFSNDNLALAARSSLNEFRLYISNTPKFERAFHHEMYHLLEYYMQDTKMYLYSSWNNLNPVDFKYESDVSKLNDKYVYKEITENLIDEESITSEYIEDEVLSDDSINPYFVTKYSKVTEKEDRAEIFAEIMILSIKPRYLYKEQNIRKKAELLDNTIKVNITNEDFFYTKFLK